MKRQHIELDKFGVEKNKAFMRRLYESDKLQDAEKRFDGIDSFHRKADEDMTLDKFLDLNTPFWTLQLGWYSDTITFNARGSGTDERFAWVEAPYNENNYKVVARIYKESYGEDLEN